MQGNLRSILGYSKGSPWENAPYNFINTPQGLITMSNTNKPLKAYDANTGKFLTDMIPGKDYKFPTNKVLEIPINKSGGWIANAVNPAHKGYCTPMTKSTCTPHRKAFAMRAKNHFQELGGKYRNDYYQIGGVINDCPPGYVKDETGQCVEDNGYNPIQEQQKGAPIQSIIKPLIPEPPGSYHPEQEFDDGLADDNPAKKIGSLVAGTYKQTPQKKKDPRPPFQSVVNTSQMAIGAVHAGLSIFGNYLEEARQKKWMQKQMAGNFNATYSSAQNDYGVDPYEQTGQLRSYLKCGGKKKHQSGGKFNIYEYLYGDEDESVEDTKSEKIDTPKKQQKRITEEDIDQLEALGLSPEDLIRETQDGVNSSFRPTSNKGFRSFSTYEEGKKALINQLNIYKTDKSKTGVKSNSSLLEAMSIYAPASDNNNPTSYANTIAKRLGINVNTPISNINTEQWANEIERVEGNKVGNNPGNLRPYQQGGRTPIIVNNPNDLRLKAYNDSLTLHNASNKSLIDFNKEDYGSEYSITDGKNVFEAFKRLKNPKPIETKTKYLPYSKTNNESLPISVKLYKKPVQPVVYQQEQKDYPIHILPKAQVRGTITPSYPEIIPEPEGQPIYGPSNGLVGYMSDSGFKPTLRRDHLAKNNQADIDLLNNSKALEEYVKKRPRYKMGGVHDVDEQEIQRLIKLGYKIERL